MMNENSAEKSKKKNWNESNFILKGSRIKKNGRKEEEEGKRKNFEKLLIDSGKWKELSEMKKQTEKDIIGELNNNNNSNKRKKNRHLIYIPIISKKGSKIISFSNDKKKRKNQIFLKLNLFKKKEKTRKNFYRGNRSKEQSEIKRKIHYHFPHKNKMNKKKYITPLNQCTLVCYDSYKTLFPV